MYGDDTLESVRQQIRTPLPTPKAEPKFNAWGLVTAIPRGIGEASLQVMGTAVEVVTALKYMRDTPTKDMPAGVPVEAMQSDFADSLRDRGREFRPDPETAHAAEQVLYGFSRIVSKVIGAAVLAGLAGVVAAGIEEGVSVADDLKRQGVKDPNVRAQAGAMQGAGLALAALPVVGPTLKSTLGLWAVGGPGSFMATQALTRKILQDAGHGDIAAGYDPLDPVGLTISSLIPAAFAAHGIKAQKAAAVARADAELLARTKPGEQTGTAAAVRDAYSPEVVDAARVAYAVEQRAAANPQPWSMRSADIHEQALSRAEDAMARGEPVNVADLYAPAPVEAVSPEAVATARLMDQQIAGLEAELQATLPAAANLAERGAIREARQQIALMEQTRVDASDAAIKALAKDIQTRDGTSFKAALSQAKKQIGDLAQDWQAQRDRLDQFIADNAEAQKQTQRAGEIEKQLTVLREQRQALPSITSFADAIDQLRQLRNPDAAPQADAAPPAKAPEPAAPQGKPRDLRAELIALRKEESVLNKLLECLNG